MNPLIKTILSTNAGAGLAILRIVTGLTLMSHGSQKLFGMFGGAGLNGMAQWFESIGLTLATCWRPWPAAPSSSAAWRW